MAPGPTTSSFVHEGKGTSSAASATADGNPETPKASDPTDKEVKKAQEEAKLQADMQAALQHARGQLLQAEQEACMAEGLFAQQ